MEVHRNKIASPLPQLFYPGTSLGRFTLAELQAAECDIHNCKQHPYNPSGQHYKSHNLHHHPTTNPNYLTLNTLPTTEEISITSPFYERKHLHTIKCKCEYHKKMEILQRRIEYRSPKDKHVQDRPMLSPCQYHRHENENYELLGKGNRQREQGGKDCMKIVMTNSKSGERLKTQPNECLNNQHAVDCHNPNFERFLKEKNLFILSDMRRRAQLGNNEQNQSYHNDRRMATEGTLRKGIYSSLGSDNLSRTTNPHNQNSTNEPSKFSPVNDIRAKLLEKLLNKMNCEQTDQHKLKEYRKFLEMLDICDVEKYKDILEEIELEIDQLIGHGEVLGKDWEGCKEEFRRRSRVSLDRTKIMEGLTVKKSEIEMKKSEEKKDKKLIEVINIALDKIKNKYLQEIENCESKELAVSSNKQQKYQHNPKHKHKNKNNKNKRINPNKQHLNTLQHKLKLLTDFSKLCEQILQVSSSNPSSSTSSPHSSDDLNHSSRIPSIEKRSTRPLGSSMSRNSKQSLLRSQFASEDLPDLNSNDLSSEHSSEELDTFQLPTESKQEPKLSNFHKSRERDPSSFIKNIRNSTLQPNRLTSLRKDRHSVTSSDDFIIADIEEDKNESDHDDNHDHSLSNEPVQKDKSIDIKLEKPTTRTSFVSMSILSKRIDSFEDENPNLIQNLVDKNKQLLDKVENNLISMSCENFVINLNDGLLTKKRKIRAIYKALKDQQTSNESIINEEDKEKKEYYNEILRYLEIYSEYCELTTKKKPKKTPSPRQPSVDHRILDRNRILIEQLEENICSEQLSTVPVTESEQSQLMPTVDTTISMVEELLKDIKKEKELKFYKLQIVAEVADPFEQFVIELVDGCKEIGKTKREEGKKSERSVKHKHIEGKSESICQKGYRENVILKMAAIVGEQEKEDEIVREKEISVENRLEKEYNKCATQSPIKHSLETRSTLKWNPNGFVEQSTHKEDKSRKVFVRKRR